MPINDRVEDRHGVPITLYFGYKEYTNHYWKMITYTTCQANIYIYITFVENDIF